MQEQNLLRKIAIGLLAFGLIGAQVPVYAQLLPDVPETVQPVAPVQMQAQGPATGVELGQINSMISAPVQISGAQAIPAPVQISAAQGIPTPVQISAAQADPAPATTILSGTIENSVEALTKDIVRDEIKLERFNLNYRSNAAKQGRWKGLRYFFFQESSLLCVDSAEITTIAANASHLRLPPGGGGNSFTRERNNLAGNGGALPAPIGGEIGAAGDILELLINTGHSIAAQRHGYGSKESRRTVVQAIQNLDKKLAERERLIRELPPQDKDIAELQSLEGKVLADFRDMALAEFERYHTQAKKTLTQQNSFYVLDCFRQALGNVAGYSIVALFSSLNHPPPQAHYTNVFGACACVQGGLTIVNPILARVAGKMVEKADRANFVKAGLPLLTEKDKMDALQGDYTTLCNFCTNHRVNDRPDMTAAVHRLEMFAANQGFYTNEIQSTSKALRRGNKTAFQFMGISALVGMGKLAQANTILCAGSTREINSPPPNDGRVGNQLVLWGTVAYLPMLMLATGDNLRVNLGNEVRRARLKRDHQLPGQIIHDRLQLLDKIEKSI